MTADRGILERRFSRMAQPVSRGSWRRDFGLNADSWPHQQLEDLDRIGRFRKTGPRNERRQSNVDSNLVWSDGDASSNSRWYRNDIPRPTRWRKQRCPAENRSGVCCLAPVALERYTQPEAPGTLSR